DLVTGERLSKVERGISLACMIIPVVNGKMVIKGGKKLVKIGSEISGSVIKVGNAVTKNTAKYKVYLRKIWIDEKVNINKYIGEAKDTVRKIKNGELYSYEYITPDGQRIKVRDIDDVPKNRVVYSSGSGSNGIYEKADYHGNKNNAVKNKAPNKGQDALDNSVAIGSNTTRRVGISDGEIVVFDETTSGNFHGHVRSWNELSETMKAVLRKAGMVNKKGKIVQ
ncbi:MAG: hypothetical protein II992_00055, partial [Lachnospiraceae bacterium]|nr:hypothetical protein [Lachnospiraceae bacterium]